MIMILLIVEDGMSIVKTIAIPMILVNSFGSFILLSMIQAYFASGRERKGTSDS